MAKRKTDRKAKSRKKSKARKAPRRSISAAPKKATKARKRAKRVSGFTSKFKRPMKKSNGPSGMKGIVADLLDTGMGSAGAYLGEWGATKVPIASPLLKGVALIGAGVLVKRMGVPAIGRGIAYESGKAMLKNLLPIPGGAAGIGTLTPEEVAIIERAAMSDAVNGVTEETILGNPNRSATELL